MVQFRKKKNNQRKIDRKDGDKRNKISDREPVTVTSGVDLQSSFAQIDPKGN